MPSFATVALCGATLVTWPADLTTANRIAQNIEQTNLVRYKEQTSRSCDKVHLSLSLTCGLDYVDTSLLPEQWKSLLTWSLICGLDMCRTFLLPEQWHSTPFIITACGLDRFRYLSTARAMAQYTLPYYYYVARIGVDISLLSEQWHSTPYFITLMWPG